MQYQTVSVRPSQSKGWRRERRRERRATNSQRLHFRLSLTDNNELSCFGDCLKVPFIGLDLSPIAAAEARGVVDDGEFSADLSSSSPWTSSGTTLQGRKKKNIRSAGGSRTRRSTKRSGRSEDLLVLAPNPSIAQENQNLLHLRLPPDLHPLRQFRQKGLDLVDVLSLVGIDSEHREEEIGDV